MAMTCIYGGSECTGCGSCQSQENEDRETLEELGERKVKLNPLWLRDEKELSAGTDSSECMAQSQCE